MPLGSPLDTFERYRRQGLEARRAGQWGAARTYLLEAARSMVELSRQARGEQLREARRTTAAKLLELANDCKQAEAEGRRPSAAGRSSSSSRSGGPQASREGGDGEAAGRDWAIRERPDITFDDVAGLEDVKQDIRLKMLYPFRHPDLAERFGIRPGGGILLYGPPGTGKTMLARATAGEIDATFFTVSAADLLSKWVGEAEQNVKSLFDAAAAEPRSVLFIDEIESLVPARRDEGSSVMQRVVPQILQGMEGFKKDRKRAVLFMGATNVPWQLDPAVLRPGRFDEKVYIGLPDLPARRKLLDIHLASRPLCGQIDIDALAERLEGYSGADIKYIGDRSASIPFLRSISSASAAAEGEAGEGGVGEGEGGGAIVSDAVIDMETVDAVLAETPPSVTPAILRRFDEWRTAHG